MQCPEDGAKLHNSPTEYQRDIPDTGCLDSLAAYVGRQSEEGNVPGKSLEHRLQLTVRGQGAGDIDAQRLKVHDHQLECRQR